MSDSNNIRYLDENFDINEIKETLRQEEAKSEPNVNILKDLRYKRLIFILKQSKIFTSQITKHMKDNFIEQDTYISHENNQNLPNKRRKIGENSKKHVIQLMPGGELYPYQFYGVHWMKSIFESGFNGILGDEMGLGKTIQVIGFIANLIEENCPGPYLILGPLSTLDHWSKEFERFTPEIETVIVTNTAKEVKSRLNKLSMKKTKKGFEYYPIVITNYERLCGKNYKDFKKLHWVSVFIDEGHRLKSEKNLLRKNLFGLKNSFRLLLTGTPIQNNLKELWSLLNFLLPDLFDDASLFESWFSMNDFNDDQKILEEESQNHIFYLMKEILHPFLLRRIKSDVNINLPSKSIITVYGYMTESQKELYTQILEKKTQQNNENEDDSANKPNRVSKAKANIMMKTGNIDRSQVIPTTSDYYSKTKEDFPQSQIKLTTFNLMNLRKAANHSYLVQKPYEYSTENLISSSGKLLLLDAMLKRLNTQGHRVLLFSDFVIVLDIIEEYLEYRKYNYLRLDGQVGIDQRKIDIDNFNSNNDIFIFIISTRAGGLGINLASADTIILYDTAWNPQIDLQAQDRCHRIGQTKPVVVYRLIMKGTVDEKMLDRANAKLKLNKLLMPKGEFTKLNDSSKSFDPWELLNLIQMTEDTITVHSNGLMYTDEELDKLMDRNKIFEDNITDN